MRNQLVLGRSWQALVDGENNVTLIPDAAYSGFKGRASMKIYCDETRHERHAISVTS